MEDRLLPVADLLGDALPAGLVFGRSRRLGFRSTVPLLAAGVLASVGVLAWGRSGVQPAAPSAPLPVIAEGRSGDALAVVAARAAEEMALSAAENEPAMPPPVPAASEPADLAGEASFYAAGFEGRLTASGESYRAARFTAAHRSLPFGTRLRVTNLRNGRSVVVRVNDRGPFHPRRVVDLSRAAAAELGMLHRGRAKVRLELLSG